MIEKVPLGALLLEQFLKSFCPSHQPYHPSSTLDELYLSGNTDMSMEMYILIQRILSRQFYMCIPLGREDNLLHTFIPPRNCP